MANKLYIAEDGSIHRYPETVVNNTENHTNTYVPAPAAAHTQAGAEYRKPIHQVSKSRIVCFWIVSIIVSILIAVGVTQVFGAEATGDGSGLYATIEPPALFIGALAGSILYGIFRAGDVDYNLWSYFLSALFSAGGIFIAEMVVSIIGFVGMIFSNVLIIGLVLIVISGIAGGS